MGIGEPRPPHLRGQPGRNAPRIKAPIAAKKVMRYAFSNPWMLWSQAALRVVKILVRAAAAVVREREASEVSTPGGRFCSALTPGVSQTPNRTGELVCDS